MVHTAHPTAARLRTRSLRLEWWTNAWNAMEFAVTMTLGIRANSLALIAFGLDSVIEIFASTVVIRNLHDQRQDPGDRRIHRALRLIAVAFWALAALLIVASTRALLLHEHPADSPVGIAYLAVAATAMFGLAVVKRNTALQLGSETVLAEARLTFLDGCLSTSVLAALVLNAAFGWWWADAGAALLVAAAALNGGIAHWRASAPHAEPDPLSR
jgi:divalent metal cation (Fe/Co/Zn/Cd) transporter